MLVLFTGNRGSGKTTIANALGALCAQEGIRYEHQCTWRKLMHGIFSKIWFGVYFWRFFNLYIFRVFITRLYRDIRHGRSRGSLNRIYVPLIFSYYISRLVHKKTDVVIYDTDIFSWAADTVIDGAFAPQLVRDFYAEAILPVVESLLIVVVDTPVDEAVKRWCVRDAEDISANDIKRWIHNRTQWKRAREQIIEVVCTLPGVTCVRLNGLSEPQLNAKKIFPHIKILDKKLSDHAET